MDFAAYERRCSVRVARVRVVHAGAALAAGLTLMAVSVASAQPAPPEEPAATQVPPRAFGLSTGLALESSVLNVSQRAAGSGTESILRASPSVTMVHRAGRVQGSLIYSGTLSARQGIEGREGSEYLNNLNANYVLEAIEGVGYVDARASISQRMLSAVGTPVGFLETGANRSEVGTVAASPYLRGALGSFAEYELRAGATATRSRGESTSDSDVQQGSFALRTPSRSGAIFGWGVSGARQRVRYLVSAAPTITDRVSAELAFQPDIDWRFTITGGRERTDVILALRQEYENYGAGVRWTPSARTTVDLQAEERYFGRAYRGIVAHRLARSTFQLSHSRDTNVPDPLALGQVVTLYELYFSQYATLIPDPVQRDQFVLALIAATGRRRDETVSGSLFGTSGVAAVRRSEGIWTWAGPRLTMNASAYAVDTERVDKGGVNPSSRNDNTRQWGYAAGIGWRLTPLTTVNSTGSRTMSKDTVTLARSDLKSVSLGLTSRLGPRTTGGLSASYSVLNGATESYRETALTGSLSLRF